ncbi:hypothetical protein AWC02_19035 [Mycolicibacter engbaekii]|uniref:Probable membrane transporter protein n=1 Tax=Mycolicibacter engbaekii TaxID=188915 RepID=A0A1X1T7C2_9MYCO|nr:hypothetical protein AWC02_19035 [Mycolicibacter engbaekii]
MVLLSFIGGLAVALVTAPVGVSGAVFLLPIQISVLQIPSPAVTPTNLLFNVVAIPGALARYRTRGALRSPLTTTLLAGTLPGVVVGACIRVFVIPGLEMFRLLLAGFLLPLGVWLMRRPGGRPAAHRSVPARRVTLAVAFGVGVLGGIYGIGGGSLLSPILVGAGMPLATVAPATLVTTFVTSVAGAATYVILALTTAGAQIAPHWAVGFAAGLGGLLGGYLGAHMQPRLPERVLATLLGAVAIATAVLYIAQSLH